MPAKHAAIALFATLALAAPVLAQSGPRFDDLDADRLNARQVLIEFEYDGGACDEVGEAKLGEIVDGTLSVTFAINATAEVCTMQVVEIDVKEAVAADTSVTRVDVTLLAADGTVVARETTRVDLD